MYLSKRKSGSYFIYYYDLNGKKKTKSTKCKSKADALKVLKRFQKEYDWTLDNKVLPITFKDFRWEYLKYSETVHTVKTNLTNKDSFDFALKYFGTTQLTSITRKEMSEYLQYRQKKCSIYQARKDHINLSAAFNKAILDGYLRDNPLRGMKRIKLPEKEPVFYSKEDFNTLIESIDNQDIKDIVIFDVNTGLRLGEVTSLLWHQFNRDAKTITLDNRSFITKGKRIRTIPLNDGAYNVLLNRKKINDYIFTYQDKPINSDKFSKVFKKCVYKAEINPKLNFHSLRHTFASWLIQKGVPIYNVSKLLGHADIKTTEIYSHLRTDDLRESVSHITL